MFKIGKRVLSNAKKIGGRFNGWDILPDSYNTKPIARLNSFIDELGTISKLGRKARKDVFFKRRLVSTPMWKGQATWLDQRKHYWKVAEEKAHSDVGLKVLHDVLGSKKKHMETLSNLPDNSKNWGKRFDANYELKKINELEAKVKSYYRRFGKSPPKGRPYKEFKNLTRKGISESAGNYTMATESKAIHQPAEMEYAKGSVGKKLRALKNIRKNMAIDNAEKIQILPNKKIFALNALIERKKNNIDNYVKHKESFKRAIDSLPSGHHSKKGGNILSKKTFVGSIQYRLSDKFSDEAKRGLEIINKDISGGNSTIKELKKIRKVTASGGKIKFIRRNGRIIPIRVKE